MEESEVIEPYNLQFSDLLLLSSPLQSDQSPPHSRLESISASVMEALGPSGPGLLSVSDIPFAPSLRKSLLPLAQKLALLDPKCRAKILKKHGLGSDLPLKKPDRNVSSFALLLKFTEESILDESQENKTDNNTNNDSEEITYTHSLHELDESQFDNLGDAFKELGFCMVKLGVRLSRVCDNALKTNELEQSIIDSGSAKGRLIHYHSNLDSFILKYSFERSKVPKTKIPIKSIPKENYTVQNLWQQWHYDYGIFTVLTSPMFLSSSIEGETLTTKECPAPNGNSCLQLFNKRKNRVVYVKCPPESFLIQVGEAANVLSRGKLRSTLHSVFKPAGLTGDISRETFVVFLQPSWGKVLRDYEFSLEENEDEEMKEGDEFLEIFRKIPPLKDRLRDGMTFAEFSRETTKQYFGTNGTQSN